MIEFWFVAMLLSAIALLWILPSLLVKPKPLDVDQHAQNIVIARQKLAQLNVAHSNGDFSDDEYKALQTELQLALALDIEQQQTALNANQARRSSVNTILPIIITFALPMATGALYFSIGSPLSLSGFSHPAVDAPSQDLERQPSVEEMMAQLKTRLKDNPDDVKGWTIFARSSMSLEQYDDAVTAYQRVNELQPNDPVILVQYADAIAMRAGGVLKGKPVQLLNQALALNPDQPQGLWLAGMAAERRGEFEAALKYWQHLMPLLDNDPQSATELQGLIDNLRINASNNGVELSAASTASNVPAADTIPSKITVQVRLADELVGQANPQDVVFVFARAQSGPPMPLAAARYRVSDLPVTTVLDDQSAMMPSLKLSGFEKVDVLARVSKSGQPIASAGDLQGQELSISPTDNSTITIVINSVVE
jgi:cytochrome c-type biogenesis protein CcmH